MRWRRRNAREQHFDRELRTHLELEAEERRTTGLSPEDALYAARRMFGNVTMLKEDLRDVWRFGWLDRIKQDVTYAVRTFRKAPGFTAVAVRSEEHTSELQSRLHLV